MDLFYLTVAESHVKLSSNGCCSFKYEQDLVEAFVGVMGKAKEQWGVEGFVFEFDYNRARSDIVVMLKDFTLISFEAKLTDWRKAVQQAYINTCFSEYSYVLMPVEEAWKAARYKAEFDARKVGLCTVVDGFVDIIIESPKSVPIQKWLHQKAVSSIQTSER